MTKKQRLAKPKSKAMSFLMLSEREIAASEFKAHCLEIMDEVERLGIDVVITKHRRPVARLVPIRPEAKPFCGSMKGSAEWIGDIVSPTGESWSADERNLT
jgi:prevent-host-death family protein